jgi:L,D-peptidoglycan transpeptidase YkuD (ErfK/YbiS/YcfS/YnhG family)
MSRPLQASARSRALALVMASSVMVVVVVAGAPSTPGLHAATRSDRDRDQTRSDAGTAPCRATETAVIVETAAHRLVLCAGGRPEASFEVALGSGGVDKRRVGDNKTPLGLYPLGAPRTSQDYHVFVPVAYPTPAQARRGYTGSAIGIHGPPRQFAGALALLPLPLPDWTAGCIAVRTDAEIDRIAAWLRAHATPRVRVEPPPAMP